MACQSIRNKLHILKYHLQNSNFNLCTISETGLTQEYSSDILHVSEYDLVRLDRSGSDRGASSLKKGGGLAVFMKSVIPYSKDELIE